MKEIICIGCDHAGFEMKEEVKKKLSERGLEAKDFGTNSTASVDYPDYVHPLAMYVEENKDARGILICGSANGVAMAANKHEHIRAAVCWNKEIASLARKHNDANVLCLPARYISEKEAEEIIDTFLTTDFEGGRHEQRVEKISIAFEKHKKE